MKRQRTKCFTGCWTCRSRRIKCDEATPSCKRCRQADIECGGYGLRLSWVQYNPYDAADPDHDNGSRETSKQPEVRASRRSLVPFGAAQSLPRLSSPELDSALTALDEWRPEESSQLENGAFCVFAVQSSAPGSSDITETVIAPDDYALHTIETPHQDDDGILVASAQVFHNIHDDSTPAARPHSPFEEQSRTVPPRHLDALSMPSKQKRLIHHWITFTSRKLVLIDEPHNPCRTMMLPMALKGLVSQSASSNADVAIFHALCASAAYNLFELSGRTNEQDRVLALYHDNEAVHHLRHNLARAHQHTDQSFAMAIMACIAVEAVSGTTQRWRTHVSGGLAYLAQLQTQGLPEAALSAFRQHMVKMAILCGVAVPPHLKLFLHDATGAADGLEYTFPYYGVSRAFLRAQDHVNTLLARAPGPSDTELGDPEREKELDAFELQLYLDFPTLPPQSPAPGAGAANTVVIHHTSMAFYYAGLVFFQRHVRNTPAAAVQDLVELGLRELESIDRVGQGALGCLMLWPVLVLGAECEGAELQQRMRAWFLAQRPLGFRNLVVLEDLVATVWKAEKGTSWRQVIEQPQFDVFRL
ncbi:fungal Zn binuclear cluster domain-containing protein [Boeremia exigua]|uniref:fungal Zn binuclear cluster domain-containing protein n=1 Tax=Boeremia exigua TaxID=749465 RepID=UPI001E8D0114|nr:fungal Zn binuclear cluster domain-containing protein [Boeremia exigua]KAH6622244.1 fungal Zn binuclear cluster domain-containing protein [Boeremia exigua]